MYPRETLRRAKMTRVVQYGSAGGYVGYTSSMVLLGLPK